MVPPRGSGVWDLDIAHGLQTLDNGEQMRVGAGQIHVEQVTEPARLAAERVCLLLYSALPATDVVQAPLSFGGGACETGTVHVAALPGGRGGVVLTALQVGLVLLKAQPPAFCLVLKRGPGFLDLIVPSVCHIPLGITEPLQRIAERLDRGGSGIDVCHVTCRLVQQRPTCALSTPTGMPRGPRSRPGICQRPRYPLRGRSRSAHTCRRARYA